MAAPIITPLPAPPVRSDAPADFSSKADAFVAALPGFVTQANAQADFNDQRAIDSDASATASANSASAAALSATQAQAQVALAADQVALATAEADRSQGAADSAQVSAAAAGAAAGLPSLTGNAGKVLGVNSGATGVAWIDSLPSLTGNAGATLMVNAAGTAAVWVILGQLYVADQKPTGTSGVSSSGFVGAYATRTLNTVISNGIPGSSLSSDQVTLPAGKYRIYVSAPATNVDAHKARLYNVTSSSVIREGGNNYAGSGATTRAEVRAEITLASTATIRVEHRVTSGSGAMGSADRFGGVETYSEMLIEKVA